MYLITNTSYKKIICYGVLYFEIISRGEVERFGS